MYEAKGDMVRANRSYVAEEKHQNTEAEEMIQKVHEKINEYKEKAKESIFLIFLSLISGIILLYIPIVREIGGFFLFLVIPILLISIPYYGIQILRLKISPQIALKGNDSALPGPATDSGYCTHCLAKIEAGDLFCTECGEPAQSLLSLPSVALQERKNILSIASQDQKKNKDTELLCCSCGAKLRFNSNFCYECGRKIISSYQISKKTIEFDVEEWWRKDIEAMGLKKSSRQPCIALNAKRIIFSTEQKLHIFNFDGVREQAVTCEGGTSIKDVTSDCSRIFIWAFPNKILVYTPNARKQLEIKVPEESSTVRTIKTSLDGKVFAAMSGEYLSIFGGNGDSLIIFKALSQYLPFVGRTQSKFTYLDLAPNGDYIAFKYEGGPDGFVVYKVPDIDILQRIPDDQRGSIWHNSVVEGLYGHAASYSLANNRIVKYNYEFFRSRKIEILDIIGLKSDKFLSDYELIGKYDRIFMAKITSNGKYFLYAIEHPSKNEISFNIFDVETRTAKERLLTFPKTVKLGWLENIDTSLCPSHDGSKLIAIVGREVIMFSIDIE